jgi:hypothetical protein
MTVRQLRAVLVKLPKRAVVAAEEREESKQVKQEGDHRVGILSGSEPTYQPLGQRTEFWRRTGCYAGDRTPASRNVLYQTFPVK